ncbi:MAG: cytochrome d ubiquinol oxidase subunit II, partial [Flavobacteriaceae bacterium]|nr:cytochrome d ubiquinol oxidase subunit II [Flavobacteriaceae bacterium]
MEVFWHVVIATILGIFFVLGGYGYGTGIIHLFFAKTENDKDVIAKSSGEFWVLKEIWLIAGICLLSVTFPLLFYSAFKGFYIYLVVIVGLIVLRTIGLRLRSKFTSQTWKNLWYKAFGLSSILLAFFFGVALGNII